MKSLILLVFFSIIAVFTTYFKGMSSISQGIAGLVIALGLYFLILRIWKNDPSKSLAKNPNLKNRIISDSKREFYNLN